MNRLLYTAAATALIAAPVFLPARTKMVTLPERAELTVSLENAQRPLLYETREILLQQGTNFIEFSWKGVNIDPRSVMMEFLSNPGDGPEATKLIATGFPPNENALSWQVFSPEDRMERIRVSYILQGVTHESFFDWRVNEDETHGIFRHYVNMANRSGEDLDNTLFRFREMDPVTRSVRTQETRRFMARQLDELPVTKLYVSRPGYQRMAGEDGEDIMLVYELENVEDAGFRNDVLPGGKIRLHGDDGLGSSIFLGESILEPTAPNESAEIILGKVSDVTLKRHLVADRRTNEKYTTGDRRTLVMFDQVRQLRYEAINYKNEPVTLRVHEPLNGQWEITEIDGAEWERKSRDEILLTIDIPAAETTGEPGKTPVNLLITVKNRFPGES